MPKFSHCLNFTALLEIIWQNHKFCSLCELCVHCEVGVAGDLCGEGYLGLARMLRVYVFVDNLHQSVSLFCVLCVKCDVSMYVCSGYERI